MQITFYSEAVTVTAPDLMSVGNSGHYLKFLDASGDVARCVVVGGGMSFEGFTDGRGNCFISIQPLMLKQFEDNTPEFNKTRTKKVGVVLYVYDRQDNRLDDVTTDLFFLYGTITPRTTFAGTRYVTYNPNQPSQSQFITLLCGADERLLVHSNVTGYTFILRPTEGLFVNVPLDGRLIDPKRKINITTEGVSDIIKGQRVPAVCYIRGYVDNRKCDALVLSWYDANGLPHMRTFAKKVRGVSSTTKELTKSVVFTNYEDEVVLAKKECKVYQEFGDNALPEEHFDDVASLATAKHVKCWLNVGDTESVEVTVEDFSLSVNHKKHVFDFSAKFYLPEIEII